MINLSYEIAPAGPYYAVLRSLVDGSYVVFCPPSFAGNMVPGFSQSCVIFLADRGGGLHTWNSGSTVFINGRYSLAHYRQVGDRPDVTRDTKIDAIEMNIRNNVEVSIGRKVSPEGAYARPRGYASATGRNR